MFRKHFGFRRKVNEESDLRQVRTAQSTSKSRSSSTGSRAGSNATQEISEESTTSIYQQSEPVVPTNSKPSITEPLSTTYKKIEVVSDPIGLNVVYTPEHGHKVDIVFVHGLGGTSRLSWSKYKNLDLFWPLTFLPLEPDICLARILTFGYNASIMKASNTGSSVLDFAKDLLFDLKYAKNEQTEELHIGDVPVIFVVHSMGGLIVKEAYMQGQNDPEYESIIKAVTAILFLSTPHRGTNLAETLNRILQSSFITNSKQYISDLAKNSFTLQKLNEQFRHIAPRLDIVSFYETQPTSIGFKNTRIMVLEKDSSVLGYPGETSKPLDADHHGVCKYDSPRDPSYITVRNVLKSLVSKIISASLPKVRDSSGRTEFQDLKTFLAIKELPDVDYIFFRDQWTPGTGEWILQNDIYLEWLHTSELNPRLLWLHGSAASGKSVLSSFIINSLVDQSACCQYFFIRFGDHRKRMLSTLLRSLAFQMAQTIPQFQEQIVQLMGEATMVETADSRTIWERIFKSILFNIEITQPLYWIIDGVDEADDSKAIIKLLSEISLSSLPLRVLLISRKTTEIMTAVQRIPQNLNIRMINVEGHTEDLHCYIHQELDMAGTAEYREKVTKRVLDRAQNNFLWVRLAVEKLNSCHTQTDVEIALESLPLGMEALYERMAASISQNTSPKDQALALIILAYVTCSLRVLTVTELSLALEKDAPQILDFQRTIMDLCGGFVVIDNGGNVAMIHQTAREFLLDDQNRRFHVNRNAAHEQLFLSCMRCLTAVGLRAKINRDQSPEFLAYAASSWSSHLLSTPLHSEHAPVVLDKFLKGHGVLTWIHFIAVRKELRALIQASRNLSKYSSKRKEYDARQHPMDRQIVEQERIDSWAIDLVKIVGKFGANLGRNPESIYKLIPPFCPQNSSIYQLFGKKEAKNLTVLGLLNEEWDDSLARMSLGPGTYASSILASGDKIAIMISSGTVLFYYASTFEQASQIKHGERLYRMEMNSNSTLLATYGYRTTKVWEIATGNCKISIPNIDSRPRPLTMLFSGNSSKLLVGSDDKTIRSLDFKQTDPSWQLVAELKEPELNGHFLNSSSYMALNFDGSLAAVAYRGHPLSAWETDGPEHIGHCWRAREAVSRGEVIQAVWHPYAPEVLGLYIEGVVFKWRPYDDEVSEISTGASKLAISKDGNFFVTGDVRGIVKIYSTADFSLIYQLASEDSVLGLAFSADSCRFYDIRGSYGNAWEPSALMRLTEQSEKNSDTASEVDSLAQKSTVSMTWSGKVNPITALITSPLGRYYCYGTEEGTVHLHDLQRGKLTDIDTSKSFMSIEQMSWSINGQYFCFSDSTKTVHIMLMNPDTSEPNPPSKKIEIPMNIITKGPIIQLLFHPDSSQLLVCTTETISIISIESSSVTHSSHWHGSRCKWAPHPQDPALLLGFTPNTIHLWDWSLVELQTFEYEYLPQDNMPSEPHTTNQDAISRLLVTYDKNHIMVQISLLSQSSKESALLLFQSASLSSTATIKQQNKSTPFILPRALSAQIATPLSFLSRDRLIFFSKDSSICSVQISSSFLFMSEKSSSIGNSEDVKLLFSLPGDWISRDCLDLCSIWNRENALLCPRNGEVAVVKCAALT